MSSSVDDAAVSVNNLPGYTSGLRYPPALSSSSSQNARRSRDLVASPSPPRSAWVLERIEMWFGSVERFESSVILATRTALVDCLMYPFIPFSRQCQLFLYSPAGVSMTAPLSSIVVMHNIMNTSGAPALWRGWRSHMMLKLVTPFLDAVLLKVGKSRRKGSWNPFIQLSGMILRGIPHVVVMPLLSYTYLEIVQSTRDKVQESLWETLTYHSLFRQDELRRLPYLTLAMPTVLYGLSSAGLHRTITFFIQRFLPVRSSSSSVSSSSSSDGPSPLALAMRGLWLDYISSFLTITTLYPLQTILVRLYCQGMPALVDNVQTGTDTVFISSYYKGFVDCVTGVWDSEGIFGFFKGFSSLLVQYTLYGLMLLLLWRTVSFVDNKYRR